MSDWSKIFGKPVDLNQGGYFAMDSSTRKPSGITKWNSIMKAISWVCAPYQEDHDWISESSLAMQEHKPPEALNHDT